MEQKKSPKGKKRQSKQIEDTLWECSACTYRNNPEAFKCSMCSIRKGTSTRKPKLNPDMVEVQVQKYPFTAPSPHIRYLKDDGMREVRPSSSASNGNDPGGPVNYLEESDEPDPGPSVPKPKKLKAGGGPVPKVPKTPKPGAAAGRGRLKNLDRKNPTVHSVTVDNVTITITEYKLKPKREKKAETATAAAAATPATLSNSHASDAESDNQEPNQSTFPDSRSS